MREIKKLEEDWLKKNIAKIDKELKILSTDLLNIDKDERIKNLEDALQRAIVTIEMECDDLDYLNELKSILNGR